MAVLEIEYDGQTYFWDDYELDVDDAETIQKFVGRNLGDWSNGLYTCEVKSYIALWWILRKQAGQHPGAIAAKVPGFKPVRLFAAYAAAMNAAADRLKAEEEAEAEAEPDPTQPSPAPSSPAPAATVTTPAPVPVTQSLPG